MLQSNQLLHGRYRIESILGQGGFGMVYRAIDLRLDHQVAIKKMIPQPGISPALHAKLQEQFRREAKTLAKLQHNHLVNVTDYFAEGGNDYLVMRFVKGQSLASMIEQRGALPADDVRMWAIQLLNALNYCHRQGVLHRDIKPDNIIIRENGQAVLVDFGLVKLWDPADPRTTMAIQGFGTPAYAPLEQGILHDNTDARSDIYSLSATLYHALTGDMPLPAFQRAANPEQDQPIGQLLSSGEPTLLRAVTKGMSIARNERFDSAYDMREALVNVPSSPIARPTSQTMLLGLSGVLGILVLMLTILLWRDELFGNEITPTATTAEVAVVETETLTPVPEPAFTNTPAPTDTVLPTPTDTQAPTPLPTATNTLIPTDTPLPTETPTPTFTPTLETRRISDVDGMVQLLVPAGVFRMGSSEDEITTACEQYEEVRESTCNRVWFSDETPQQDVFLDEFWIDETEVTNAQYRICVEAGACSSPFDTRYYNDDSRARHPVVYVNWRRANAYCEWAGRKLPTEAQWEKAARGTDGRIYPWGNQRANASLANYGVNVGTTTEVGSYTEGASPYGALDMAGNVWEWTASPYDPYPYEDLENYENNGERVVLRGGAWYDSISSVRAADRDHGAPSYDNYNVGVRCVQAVQTP